MSSQEVSIILENNRGNSSAVIMLSEYWDVELLLNLLNDFEAVCPGPGSVSSESYIL